MITATEKGNKILDILRKAEQTLQHAGIIACRYEAEILFCHVLQASRVDLYTQDLPVSNIQRLQFEKLVNQRAVSLPLQYLIGRAEFFGLEFLVSPGVFIPRPETEVLVETVVHHIGDRSDKSAFIETGLSPSVCDLCTGCGCIAISLAKYAKCGNIVATDISEKALKTAQRNAISNGIAEKIEFRKADLFNGLIPAEKFDIIVCNPPYIRKKDLEKLPPEVRMEPLIALDGGEDGLDFYRSITSKASEFLKDNGILAMEMGDGQAGDVKKMFSDRIEFIRDLNGIDRVLIWVNKGGY